MSLFLLLSLMFLSIQIGFSLAIAITLSVCAALASTSGLDPYLLIMTTRYLNCVTCSSFCPPTIILVWVESVLLVVSLVFSALIFFIIFGSYLIQALQLVYELSHTAIYSMSVICKPKVCNDCTRATLKPLHLYTLQEDIDIDVNIEKEDVAI